MMIGHNAIHDGSAKPTWRSGELDVPNGTVEVVDDMRPNSSKHLLGHERKKTVPYLVALLLLALISLAIALGLGMKGGNQSINQPGMADMNSTVQSTAPPSTYTTDSPQQSSSPTRCPSYPPLPALSGKKGIAYTMREEGQRGSWVENLPKVEALAPYWFYSWGPQIPDEARLEGVEFLPMVWGAQSYLGLNDTLDKVLSDTSARRLLGFNEPDREQQANMEVDSALNYWSLLTSLNLPLISPACAETTKEWMKEFMEKAEDNCLRVDAVAIHWYGSADVATFQKDLKRFYQVYGKPLMITEFAPADWDAQSVSDNMYSRQQILGFMQEALPWLEAQDWILAYSWFPFEATNPFGTSSALYGTDGNMTELGMFYASVSNENPFGNQSIAVQ